MSRRAIDGDRARNARILVLQPALPSYRLDLFDRLAERWGPRLRVAASPGQLGVLTDGAWARRWLVRLGPHRQALGLSWQEGAWSLAPRRGDVLVVAGMPRALSTLALVGRARAAGATVVWWGHYLSPNGPPWRLRLRLALMRAAHAVMFYTMEEVEAYRRGPGRGDRRPVVGLGNGVNLDPVATHRRPYRAEVREPAILFLGRVTPKADLPLLLEALSRPEAQGLRLLVLGDGAGAAAARRRAADLGLGGRVEWHPGSTDEAEIAAVANRARLFAYAGEVGLSLIHAMAYGLPAVVHRDPSRHMPEFAAFADGVTGSAFTTGDPADLARVLGSASRETDLLDAMSRRSLARVETSFTTEVMAERFGDLVDRLLAQGAAP